MSFLLRALGSALLLSLAPACSSSSDGNGDDVCKPDDADGILGTADTFEVTVTDDAFAPKVLASQNLTHVTLRLTNDGTTPHGFVIACLQTPNDDGCPTASCFPDEAKVEPLEPGDSRTIEFEVPLVEGIHAVSTGVEGDAAEGQFIVQ
jgi:hypothetical protein